VACQPVIDVAAAAGCRLWTFCHIRRTKPASNPIRDYDGDKLWPKQCVWLFKMNS